MPQTQPQCTAKAALDSLQLPPFSQLNKHKYLANQVQKHLVFSFSPPQMPCTDVVYLILSLVIILVSAAWSATFFARCRFRLQNLLIFCFLLLSQHTFHLLFHFLKLLLALFPCGRTALKKAVVEALDLRLLVIGQAHGLVDALKLTLSHLLGRLIAAHTLWGLPPHCRCAHCGACHYQHA